MELEGTNVANFGAFVDVIHQDGLVHISQLWFVDDPKVVKVGQGC